MQPCDLGTINCPGNRDRHPKRLQIAGFFAFTSGDENDENNVGAHRAD